ncbi:Protein dom34 [Rhodotorula toruloides]|nr:Protein dom34 [Rhodotorula toruloides]
MLLDQSGSVTLRPQDDEDMWHAYNLISKGDELRASAVRRVTSESATGSTSSQRVHLKLTIRVDKVLYSALAQPDSTASASSSSAADSSAPVAAASGTSGTTTLHVSGKITSENEHVKKGAYHTLDLEIGRDFTIIKGEGEWDSVARERLREMTEPGRGADVGAVVCGEGTANICIITNHTTIVKQRIDVPVPRKRKGGGTALGAERANSRFLHQVYDAVNRHFDFEQLKVLIIASPGFTKETVHSFLLEEAVRQNNKALIQAKSKFLLLHSPTHHVHSLTQILSSPEVSSQLKDTKFAQEGVMLEKCITRALSPDTSRLTTSPPSRFFKMLEENPLRAWYGESHVFKAAERGAIGKLLVSDELFRSPSVARRKKFVQLVEDVKAYGGEVLMFSSMHESGQQLNQLTGIAAILTYPLDIEVVEEEERAEREEEEKRRREAGEEQDDE